MREPRIMRSSGSAGPGGALRVDVTALQMGLGRCRALAEAATAAAATPAPSQTECLKILAQIEEVARETMVVVDDDRMNDEIGGILQQQENQGE